MAKIGLNVAVGADISEFSTKMQNMRRDIEKSSAKLKRSATIMSTMLVGVGVASIKAAADMESLGIQLRTAFQGNETAAKKALSQINDFTAKTPFQLQEVADGFIQLKNRGLDPSMDSMRAIGDMAAAMGKDFGTAVQAVAQATVGEMEMLKQFGIVARQNGDEVSFTFRGVTKVVKKEASEIQKYLMDLSKANFAGATEDQSKSLKGQLSTLKDNVALLAADLGNLLLPSIKNMTVGLTQFVGKLKEIDPKMKSAIVDFGKFAVGAGLVITTLSKFPGIVPSIVSGVATIATTFKIMIPELLAMSAALVGLYALYQQIPKMKNPYAMQDTSSATGVDKLKKELENAKAQVRYFGGKASLEQGKFVPRDGNLSPEKLEQQKKNTEKWLKVTEDLQSEIDGYAQKMAYIDKATKSIADNKAKVLTIEELTKEQLKELAKFEEQRKKDAKLFSMEAIGAVDKRQLNTGGYQEVIDKLIPDPQTFADRTEEIKNIMLQTVGYIQELPKATESTWTRVEKRMYQFKSNMEQVAKDLSLMVQDLIVNTLGSFFEEFGKNLQNGDNSFKNFGDQMLANLATFISQFGDMLLVAGIGKIALDGLSLPGGGAAAIAAGALMKTTAGIIRSHLENSSSAMTRGASSSGVASGGGTLTAVIRGGDLYLMTEEYSKRRK